VSKWREKQVPAPRGANLSIALLESRVPGRHCLTISVEGTQKGSYLALRGLCRASVLASQVIASSYVCASRMVTLSSRAFVKDDNCLFQLDSRMSVCTKAGEHPAPDGCSHVWEGEAVNTYLSSTFPPVRSLFETVVLWVPVFFPEHHPQGQAHLRVGDRCICGREDEGVPS
jgi:hypothetical protein